MSGQSITAIFGANSTQTSSAITIQKADLATVGLTASANNDGEALLAAIILLAQTYLTTANQTATPAIQTTITNAVQPSYVTRSSTLYRRDAITVNLDSVSSTFTINPNNY